MRRWRTVRRRRGPRRALRGVRCAETAGGEDRKAEGLPPRPLLRGTLCFEGQLVAREILGPIWSNTPLDKSSSSPTASRAGAHHVDYGEDEFTQGRLHR